MQNDFNNKDEQTENYNALIDTLFNDLLEEIILDICFRIHRSSKLGFLFLDESNYDDGNNYALVNEKGFDIFGQNSQLKKQYECVCPSCQRNLSAQRFAPHLEKCMGMGRNSSRIASKRIASVTGKCNEDSDEETIVRKVKKKKLSKKANNSNLNNNATNGNLNNGLTI